MIKLGTGDGCVLCLAISKVELVFSMILDRSAEEGKWRGQRYKTGGKPKSKQFLKQK